MEVNADFTRPALVQASRAPWIPSPMPGVERRMLDRVGDEVARATSIVRYAPGSHFSSHVHEGGEEFIVLEGTFEDEHGAYPAGSYVRNPPTSQHVPRSREGCTIFVKLWQFRPDDRVQCCKYMPDELQGVSWDRSVAFLHEDEEERVTYTEALPGAPFSAGDPGGIEILVLAGSLCADSVTLHRHSWLRLPPGQFFEGAAGPQGARIWMKTGHLQTIRQPTA
ncbi:cupin domain-containing protein [Marinobacteraceae bacterium S3BR75-40.1]